MGGPNRRPSTTPSRIDKRLAESRLDDGATAVNAIRRVARDQIPSTPDSSPISSPSASKPPSSRPHRSQLHPDVGLTRLRPGTPPEIGPSTLAQRVVDTARSLSRIHRKSLSPTSSLASSGADKNSARNDTNYVPRNSESARHGRFTTVCSNPSSPPNTPAPASSSNRRSPPQTRSQSRARLLAYTLPNSHIESRSRAKNTPSPPRTPTPSRLEPRPPWGGPSRFSPIAEEGGEDEVEEDCTRGALEAQSRARSEEEEEQVEYGPYPRFAPRSPSSDPHSHPLPNPLRRSLPDAPSSPYPLTNLTSSPHDLFLSLARLPGRTKPIPGYAARRFTKAAGRLAEIYSADPSESALLDILALVKVGLVPAVRQGGVARQARAIPPG